ncbi:MAG: alpha/beta hydrolase [Stagnimonas sp.]|nr:alpha/beta hydrolase [Stagnimonas sp.]
MAIFERAGIQLFYEIHGEGPAVLLIHGLGSSGLDWEYQLPALRGYQVISVDLRGHGRSTRGAKIPISIELFAQDLAALLEHLGIASAHVVGLSLGGGVAFQLALDQPARVRSLSIVNSGPHAITNPFLAALVVGSRLLTIRLAGLPKLGEKVAGRLFPKPEHAHKKASFIERFAGNDVDCYRASLKALIGWSVQHRLSEITAPVLVLTADQDYTSVKWKRAYTARLRNAQLVVVPDSRHALPMENPEPFNAALLGFLQAQP